MIIISIAHDELDSYFGEIRWTFRSQMSEEEEKSVTDKVKGTFGKITGKAEDTTKKTANDTKNVAGKAVEKTEENADRDVSEAEQ